MTDGDEIQGGEGFSGWRETEWTTMCLVVWAFKNLENRCLSLFVFFFFKASIFAPYSLTLKKKLNKQKNLPLVPMFYTFSLNDLIHSHTCPCHMQVNHPNACVSNLHISIELLT